MCYYKWIWFNEIYKADKHWTVEPPIVPLLYIYFKGYVTISCMMTEPTPPDDHGWMRAEIGKTHSPRDSVAEKALEKCSR